MVTASIVRIRNHTNLTFFIKVGSSSKTGGSAENVQCDDGVIAVVPGFDQEVENLYVPWLILTLTGLEVSLKGTSEVARCVIAPLQEDDANDWLQFRTVDWKPVSEDRWKYVGRRHTFLGTYGRNEELNLDIFLDDDRLERPSIVDYLHFNRCSLDGPLNTVFLNIFDLAPVMTVPNAVLNNTFVESFGAFHAAVEVYEEEWSFYKSQAGLHSGGVRQSPSRRNHPVHVYRQSICMGETNLRKWEVHYLISCRLAPEWPGSSYRLLRKNCIHYCDEFLLALGVKGVPSWVKGLHETLAKVEISSATDIASSINTGDETTSLSNGNFQKMVSHRRDFNKRRRRINFNRRKSRCGQQMHDDFDQDQDAFLFHSIMRPYTPVLENDVKVGDDGKFDIETQFAGKLVLSKLQFKRAVASVAKDDGGSNCQIGNVDIVYDETAASSDLIKHHSLIKSVILALSEAIYWDKAQITHEDAELVYMSFLAPAVLQNLRSRIREALDMSVGWDRQDCVGDDGVVNWITLYWVMNWQPKNAKEDLLLSRIVIRAQREFWRPRRGFLDLHDAFAAEETLDGNSSEFDAESDRGF